MRRTRGTHGVGEGRGTQGLREPEQKRSIGRPKCRWKDDIKMGLTDTRWDGEDWIHLTQNTAKRQALLDTATNLQVP